ncbi:MAG: class I SAM-dependent methyltransferase [Mycobacteriales bacterium]
MSSPDYELLVHEAASMHREGWDFSFHRGRVTGGELPWSYGELARPLLDSASRLLDQDTGGGEVLARLAPLPSYTVAAEGWEPNLSVARARLEPLGVHVRHQGDARIPASDGEFDLVLNRHGFIDSPELRRVVTRGAQFLTQQVGRGNNHEFNTVFGERGSSDDGQTVDELADALGQQGFRIVHDDEAKVPCTYLDIGAVVFQLLTVSWQVPGFSVERFDAQLRALHQRIRTEGGFTVHDHRFILQAEAV